LGKKIPLSTVSGMIVIYFFLGFYQLKISTVISSGCWPLNFSHKSISGGIDDANIHDCEIEEFRKLMEKKSNHF